MSKALHSVVLTALLTLIMTGSAVSRAEPGGGTGTARAATGDAHAGRGKEQAVRMKVELLGKLVNESAAAKRVAGSSDAEARELLENAADAWRRSAAALESGQLRVAGRDAERGLADLADASRRVKDAQREQRLARERYDSLRKRVLSFSEAFSRVLEEKPGEPANRWLDQSKVSRLLDEAEALAREDDHESANLRLEQAANAVETALSEARHQETLLHKLTFETLEDEYNYELQRNDSYALLVDLLGRKSQQAGNRLQNLQRMLGENQTLREDAQDLYERGEVDAAILALEEATQRLARTLRASGVAF